MTLYLKYRPQKINELDLTSVRESLTKILNAKTIPHAFLFSGPRGSGKTSAARILAKVINCQAKVPVKPCNRCSHCKSITAGQHIDVIEMDAASNRGIDDIRSLRENVNLAPASAMKKIYIIDEAHMLTTEASNALLKTLEEPPSHVMFVLATTDPQKLLETIRSRTTNINFTKATDDEIARQLSRVIKGEGFNIDKEVINMIAEVSDGSFREAIKILESLATDRKKITIKKAKDYLNQNKAREINTLINYLIKKNCKASLDEVENQINIGVTTENLLEGLLSVLRKALLAEHGIGEAKLDMSQSNLISLLNILLETNLNKNSVISQLPLEIAIIKWCGSKQEEPAVEIKVKNEKPEIKNSKPIKVGEKLDDDVWSRILKDVRSENVSIEGLLRAVEPLGFDGKTINLGVCYRFHKEKLEAVENLRILESVVESVIGVPVKILINLTEKKAKPVEEKVDLTNPADEDIIQAAKEIFGDV